MKQTLLCYPEALGSHGHALQSLSLVSCHAASQVPLTCTIQNLYYPTYHSSPGQCSLPCKPSWIEQGWARSTECERMRVAHPVIHWLQDTPHVLLGHL